MSRYSQYGEDDWILRNIKLPEKGVFIEVGAYDGIDGSNTLLFEERGWTGLLIEPNPTIAVRCMVNRNVPVIIAAIAEGPVRPGPFFINQSDPTLSGLKRDGRSLTVTLSPLGELLRFHRVDQVDLLSIDTEGTELEVWASLGKEIRPGVVIIEHNTVGLPLADEKIMEVLTGDGYEFRHKTEGNMIFELKGK
jgi:FkbM family methyltransferase